MIKKFAKAMAINNFVTILLYWVLMQKMAATDAYLITWLVGLMIVFILYPKILFNQKIHIVNHTNFKLLACYVFSLLVTLMYIRCVEGTPEFFIAISSVAFNGILNIAVVRLIGGDWNLT
jgi:hypothetical protein